MHFNQNNTKDLIQKQMWLLFSAIMVCVVDYSSPCLLTRPSGSSDSWPRNKSRTIPFPSGFGWKLVKSGTTPGGSIGEEPSCVSKGSHVRWHTYLLGMKAGVPFLLLCKHHYYLKNTHVLSGKLFFCYYAFATVGWLSNKYVRPFVRKKKYRSRCKNTAMLYEASL